MAGRGKAPHPVRVLFLNPPDLGGQVWMKEVGRCGRRSVGGEVWPQTGLAYLAAVVEREGHAARIIDCMATPMPIEQLERECLDWHPDVIVANSATPTIRNDAEVLERLARATAAICGFVGPHVSALPEETLAETQADFGMINEAEETVADLVRALAALMAREPGPGDLNTADRVRGALRGIPGLVWRHPPMDEEGHVARPDLPPARKDEPRRADLEVNPPRDLVADLDSLPMPARHLLPNRAYRMPFFGAHPFATIIPARGCPWPCTFCRAGRVWGRRVRSRSVDSILAEVRSLVEDFGIRHVVFMTDSLTLDRAWAMALFEALAGLDSPIEWICNSRVDSIDSAMLAAMKRAGCRMVSYGVESGDQSILDRSGKRITLGQSEKAVCLTREAGISSMAYFILGLPGETSETIEETIRFARRLNPDYVNFHLATPFPGTALYEEARREGWLASTRWEDFEEEGGGVMAVGDLSVEQLRAAQRRAMRSFYLRPWRLVRELFSLRSWADLSARVCAGVRMLQTLTKRD